MESFILLCIIFAIIAVVSFFKKKDNQNNYNQNWQKTSTVTQREGGESYAQRNTPPVQTVTTAQRDDLIFISPNEYNLEYDDVNVLRCKIAMGQVAYIIYSYSLNAPQIFEKFRREIESATLEVYGNHRTLKIGEDLNVIYFGEYDGEWSYDLIENVEFGFSAVVLSSCIARIDSSESQETLNARIKIGATISAYLKNMILEDCVIEPILIPNHMVLDDKGIYMARKEVAEAFKKSRIVKNYTTNMGEVNSNQKPDWYNSVLGKNLTSKIGQNVS